MNDQVPVPGAALTAEELRNVWRIFDQEERVDGFRMLPATEAAEFFLALPTHDQVELLRDLQPAERRLWVRRMAPDDAADLVQEAPLEERPALMELFDDPTRREVGILLAYEEDNAGGLMSPRFARVRPSMTVDDAIVYLRKQATQQLETLYYGYVLDSQQKLLGVVSLRDLFLAKGASQVPDVMNTDLVTVPEDMDQEAVGRLFAQHDLVALPVLDGAGRMKGIVTVDDIVDVVQEEATEDIQKIGGSEALDAPYLEIGLLAMLRKRGGWLMVLFVGEMFTATAMARYEHGILVAAPFLMIFLPLIIATGGNSGSQASTLVIRAMALGEVRLRDWSRVLGRELATGLLLGLVLGAIGLLRVLLWPGSREQHGELLLPLGFTILLSLVGIVLWGTVSGSMLPMVLRRLGLDPASASAPFVATLVDVTGLVIYFSIAAGVLSGTLL